MTEPRKILFLWSERISGRESGKADGLEKPEGSSPGDAMASRKDTTGVFERGMHTKG